MRPRILFVYQWPSSFILQDRALLEKHAQIEEFLWTEHAHPARALVRWMVRNRKRFDLVFVWFGDTHASVATLLARWLGKPSVIVIGGYDASDMPGYGFLATRKGVRWARGHFRRASRILAVSRTLRAELVDRFPSVAGKTDVLPTGIDVERFRPSGPRAARVLSVAFVSDLTRVQIKGWDRIIEVARSLPAVPFLLVGATDEIARKLAGPPNVEIRGPLPHDAIVRLCQTSAVYLQPSRYEGLSNAVMEAMACGCVPVATAVGGLSELVGETGFLVRGEPGELRQAIMDAFAAPELGLKARARVVESFSTTVRELGLLRVVEGLLGAKVSKR